MTKLPKHILVIRFSAMGDVAMSVPVLKALIQQHPNVQVTVVSRPFFKPIFDNLDAVTFYGADFKKTYKGVFGLYQLYTILKTLEIDAVVDLHNVLRSKFLRFLFKVNRIKTAYIDKGRSEKKALTRTKNKIFKQLKTSQERYADVFRRLGFSIDLKKVTLQPPISLPIAIANKFWSTKRAWVGIAPFAQHKGKMYPLDLMQQVILELSKKGVQIFLFGGGNDITVLQNIALKHSHVECVAGSYTFKEELGIISHLDTMLSMDSGNAHLAAMFGVPTVTIWGATHPFAGFAPFNQQAHCLLPDLEKYPDLPCSIYGNKICEGYEDAMRSIPFKKIVEKIIELLA